MFAVVGLSHHTAPIDVREQTTSWSPSPAHDTPSGTETLRADRTKLGLLIARTLAGE